MNNKNNISKEFIESLINIAEQEVLAQINKTTKNELFHLEYIKKMLPFMDLNSIQVKMFLQREGILDSVPVVVVDKREAKR